MKFARVLALTGALTAIGAFGIAAAQNTAPSAPAAAPAAASGAFRADPVHSAVIFKLRYSGVSNFYGRFNGLDGHFSMDAEKSSFEFTLKSEKVDSGNAKRDDHLKSADFFNAKEFPTITIKSTKFTKKGDNAYEVAADLTLLGKTKPVTITLTDGGTSSGKSGPRAGLEATFTFKRSEFGMNYGLEGNGLGDEVTITAGVSGVPAKSEGGAGK